MARDLDKVELGVVPNIVDLILLYWDNKGAIAKSKGTAISSKVQTSTQGDTILFEKSLVIMM